MLRRIIQTALMLTMVLFAHADEKSLDTLVVKSIVASRALPQEKI